MSNTHFTPSFYGNPFIGAIPADTADNLIYGCALLRKLDCTNWDSDESMGMYRLFEAMHGAAHHLRMALPTNDPTVEIPLSDDEAARIKDHATAAGCTPAEALRKLALNEFAKRLRRGDPEAVEADASLKAVAERMGCTVEEAVGHAVKRGLNAD